MKRFSFGSVLGLAAFALAVSGCSQPAERSPAAGSTDTASAAAASGAWAGIHDAVAVLHPTAGNRVSGVVRFSEAGGRVTVIADVHGFAPGTEHGFHIHQFGDMTAADGTSAGGHYNPEGHPHALPPATPRHAGDLGNLVADAQGNAHLEITVDDLTIAGAKNPILGRGVIVHAQPDDGGQPTGNAGARVAGGVIGVSKPN